MLDQHLRCWTNMDQHLINLSCLLEVAADVLARRLYIYLLGISYVNNDSHECVCVLRAGKGVCVYSGNGRGVCGPAGS